MKRMRTPFVLLACLFLLLSAYQAGAAEEKVVDVIVSLKGGINPRHSGHNNARAAEVAARHGMSPKFLYGTALAGFAGQIPEKRLARLQQDADVESVSFDAPVYAIGKPSGGGGTTVQTVPWGVQRIGARSAFNKGTGVDVYVLDTGIDSDHKDLQPHVGNGYAVVACTGKCVAPWDDDHGHGTHVSGTIGAVDNGSDVVGVAPEATLHAVKVLNRQGSGTISGIISGINWVAGEALARGTAAVANMSLGGTGSKTGTCTSSGYSGTDNFHRAICNARNQGVVFAVAAGNEGVDAQNSTPAAYNDAVITVSATTSAEQLADLVELGGQSGKLQRIGTGYHRGAGGEHPFDQEGRGDGPHERHLHGNPPCCRSGGPLSPIPSPRGRWYRLHGCRGVHCLDGRIHRSICKQLGTSARREFSQHERVVRSPVKRLMTVVTQGGIGGRS